MEDLVFLGRGVEVVNVDSRSGGADVGFSPCGVRVASMVSVALSVGVNWAFNGSPPEGLLGRREP